MNIKDFGIFLLGAGIGALVTYVLLKEKYEDILEEEIEAAKEDLTEHKPSPLTARKLAEANIERKNNILYRKLTKKYTPYEKIFTSDVEEKVEGAVEPWVIALDEFTNDMRFYDKITIYYYNVDDVLTNEEEEPLTNAFELIGDALLSFGDRSEDPDIVYVRNERLSTDYEVIRLNKSYQEAILGISENETKRRKTNEKD